MRNTATTTTTTIHRVQTWEVDNLLQRYHRFLGKESFYLDKNIILTRSKLKEWARNPDRRLVCIFCGTRWSTEVLICSTCREARGMMPAIVGWSVLKEEIDG